VATQTFVPTPHHHRTKNPRKQVKLWLSDEDAAFLRTTAHEREQSVSGLIRRAIAFWRRSGHNRTVESRQAPIDPAPK